MDKAARLKDLQSRLAQMSLAKTRFSKTESSLTVPPIRIELTVRNENAR